MDLLAYQSSISGKSANSICVRLSAIKSYFVFLKKIGEISTDPSDGLEKPKVNPKEKPYMTAEDVRAMINATKKTRDKAVIAFIASTGVRVSELVNITMDDYSKAIQSNREIVILGKALRSAVFISMSRPSSLLMLIWHLADPTIVSGCSLLLSMARFTPTICVLLSREWPRRLDFLTGRILAIIVSVLQALLSCLIMVCLLVLSARHWGIVPFK